MTQNFKTGMSSKLHRLFFVSICLLSFSPNLTCVMRYRWLRLEDGSEEAWFMRLVIQNLRTVFLPFCPFVPSCQFVSDYLYVPTSLSHEVPILRLDDWSDTGN